VQSILKLVPIVTQPFNLYAAYALLDRLMISLKYGDPLAEGKCLCDKEYIHETHIFEWLVANHRRICIGREACSW